MRALCMAALIFIGWWLCSSQVFAESPSIYAKDGKYLGNLNANPYDANSVANPYGRYGSPYSQDSINNPYGKYGNPYGSDSVTNPYVTGRKKAP